MDLFIYFALLTTIIHDIFLEFPSEQSGSHLSINIKFVDYFINLGSEMEVWNVWW